MAFNLLTTKTNLDETFIFVEMDKNMVEEKKLDEETLAKMSSECKSLESDIQNLIDTDINFQLLDDKSIFCIDIKISDTKNEKEDEPKPPRKFIKMADSEHEKLFGKVFSLEQR